MTVTTVELTCAFFRFWLTILISSLLTGTALAQQNEVDVYHVRVVTQTGDNVRGLLDDVSEVDLYVLEEGNGQFIRLPLRVIRKVVIYRNKRKNALISGAFAGGLVAGFLSNQSLKQSPPRSSFTYGLYLTFAAATGAAAGSLAGSAVSKLTDRRTIRPLNADDPELYLFRQLEPLTVGYQQDLINRLPTNSR